MRVVEVVLAHAPCPMTHDPWPTTLETPDADEDDSEDDEYG